MDTILTTFVAAVALGIAGQIIADRFQLPAILPLLLLGICCGPFGLAFVDPEALGDSLEALIHLGVAIILFEGGLSLDLQRLARVGAPVRNLLSVGVAVTGISSAVVAHWSVGMPWTTAALFGAIVTVTGPTVIVPLLRHMIAPKEIKTVLLSEGLIVDPIGAVLAYVVLQWIARAGIPLEALMGELLELTATGIVLGFVTGALARAVLRTRLVAGELRNLSILALLMLCYLVAESQAHQSGILAAMVMGFTISAAELPDLMPVRAFKGQLTTLIISMLFILLAAQLDLTAVVTLGWNGLFAVVLLILLVRPLSVALSIWPRHLDWRGRTVIALTAPRGIVAAAVASLGARQMNAAGIAGGSEMEGLVYLTILATGAWSTFGALTLPKLLGYTDDPARRRAVLVGANALTETLARLLRDAGRTTCAIDSVRWRLDRHRKLGATTVVGDARDAATFAEAGVERDSIVVAATTNDELNLLAAELVHAEFGVEHPVVAIQRPPDDLGRRSRGWIDLIGGGGVDVPSWIRKIENKKVRELVIDPSSEPALNDLRSLEREHPGTALRMLGFRDGEPVFAVDDERVALLDRLVVTLDEGRAFEALAEHHIEAGEAWTGPVAEAIEAPTASAAETPPTDEPSPDLV